jgi:hypothetical protein
MTITAGRPFTVAEWLADRPASGAVARQEAPHWRRGHVEPRPFPFDTLERLLRASTATDVGAAIGITRRHVLRLRATGLTIHQADRFATAAGYHPATVWPEWWSA